MYTPNESLKRRQPSNYFPPTRTQLSENPIYYVYSHYGCQAKDVDRCEICKNLIHSNTYFHSNPQTLISATQPPIVPTVQRQLSPTPIQPIRHQLNDTNDLYLLQDIPGSPQTRREAEDTAIINICLQDKSIDRIVLIDADENTYPEDDDILYVHLHEVDERTC